MSNKLPSNQSEDNMKTILPKGEGYWRLNLFPLGGDFRRATTDLAIIAIERTFSPPVRGCTHVVQLANGDKAAIDLSRAMSGM
uniref:Uncharacterized protein n=1 Tax=viral metagenome TaxID=1070528 RepID=A0A6M3XMH7_9ZZZZ